MEVLLFLAVVILIVIVIKHHQKIKSLTQQQDELRHQIKAFSQQLNPSSISKPEEVPKEEKTKEISQFADRQEHLKKIPPQKESKDFKKSNKPPKSPALQGSFEKFLGENLVNKIGIAITVIGVAFGVKYSIDNELISPLTRVILGYLAGAAILLVGMKLKSKYDHFSAVLVSGSMAIMYLITFAAYSYYDLIPQPLAFILMVVFTAFTILAAIQYNHQVIAHIGLVGAYAVPFILSDGSGNVTILFGYMTFLNIGILIIAFKKYWKPLYYVSFAFSWLIYATWYFSDFQDSTHFGIAFSFLIIFFVIFYSIFMGYKLIRKETYLTGDVISLLSNSFIFYGFGFQLLSNHPGSESLLGLYTLGNALVHFMVSFIIYRNQLADKSVFYLITGMVLVFITITIPVQLDGNWVTLLWTGEAALLFYVGRIQKASVYEVLSYPLILLALISVLQDWSLSYYSYSPSVPESRVNPIFNIHFLTSMLVACAFGWMIWVTFKHQMATKLAQNGDIQGFIRYMIPSIFIIILYGAFLVEIGSYWNQRYVDSSVTTTANAEIYQEESAEAIIEESPDDQHVSSEEAIVEEQYYPYDIFNENLKDFKMIWMINYSLLFISLLSFINLKKINNRELTFINLGLSTLTLAIFLTAGLYALSELREAYLADPPSAYFQVSSFHILIRYLSYAFAILILVVAYRSIRKLKDQNEFRTIFDLALHVALLWMASGELINWMDLGDSSQPYKLGLSILWGLYALMVIALGIRKKKRHLRIGGLALFAVTLLKLFFYDIQELNTIAKTISFVSLGILLLVISFLYNKYKHLILDEDED